MNAKRKKLDDATDRAREHLRRAVRELRSAGVSPPEAETILMHSVTGAVYGGNCPWNEWPKEVAQTS